MTTDVRRLSALSIALALVGLAVLWFPTESRASGMALVPEAEIEQDVIAEVVEKGTASFWAIFEDPISLSEAASIDDWDERGQYVFQHLTEAAESAQASTIETFRSYSLEFEPFWIMNAVLITGDLNDLLFTATRPAIERIIADAIFEVPEPLVDPTSVNSSSTSYPWNLTQINAPNVWSDYGATGAGVVVANIDTGVDYTHAALQEQYRGYLGASTFDHSYNWYDPTGTCGATPCDNNNHGTHTMGSMVGDDGGENTIGVAPGARWIAAKGCGSSWCSSSHLLAAAQWILAPTDSSGDNPDPSKRPHVVNNSWGGGGGNTWYQSMVEAWVAAGIFPVFSNGNSGPSCSTSGSPGDYVESYSVGAFSESGAIASFSSRGSSPFGAIKPDIAAPGVSVRSSIAGGSYGSYSGTSMAAPHVAGAVALLLAGAPPLVGDISEIRALLDASAVDTSDLSCGGTAADNNVWGEGKLDVLAAMGLAPVGDTGVLNGVVTDASTAAPVAEAAVQLEGPVSRTLTTDSSGAYTALVPIGIYSIGVAAPGYVSQSLDDIPLADDETVTQDFALTASERFSVSGLVTALEGAAVSGATVRLTTAAGALFATVVSATDGAYTFTDVPAAAYTLSTDSSACMTGDTENIVVSSDLVDIVLTASQLADTFGYTCTTQASAYVEATNLIALSGDDVSTEVSLPFVFDLYENSYESVWICTNGYIAFSPYSSGTSYCPYYNRPIVSGSYPPQIIAPFWDDLVVDGQASVNTVHLSEPDRFVIEWNNVRPYGGSQRWDAEVILHANGGIQFEYRNIDDDPREQGASATIGLEDDSSNYGYEWSYNEEVSIIAGDDAVSSGILFTRPNLGPETVPDEYDVEAGAVLVVEAPGVLENDTDDADLALSATLVSDPAIGALAFEADGSFEYQAPADIASEDGSVTAEFFYKACDSESLCSDSTSVKITLIGNSIPALTLHGDNPLYVQVGAVFEDPGATAYDAEDGDLTASIQVTGYVDMAIVGEYELTYSVTDTDGGYTEDVRSVIVDGIPAVTLAGDNPLYVEINTAIEDPGATASDPEDGDLTSSVEVAGDVDVSAAGQYTLTYSVTDSDGNYAAAERTIVVAGVCDGQWATITGTVGSDNIAGTSGDDIIAGLAGNDRIAGGGGSDIICGGAGRDRLKGGSGDDYLMGGTGRDLLFGQGGDDVLYGGTGRDLLYDGTGADIVDGGPGADTVIDGSGVDLSTGGAGGGDTIDFGRSEEGVAVALSQAMGEEHGVLWVSGFERVKGTRFADVVYGTSERERIITRAGADVIYGDGGNDRIDSGSGADTVWAGTGNDVIRGGRGSDLLDGGTGGYDRIAAGSGNDGCREAERARGCEYLWDGTG